MPPYPADVVEFQPLFLALVPEARVALRRLSELPFAIRVIADRRQLSGENLERLEDVGQILIDLDLHVIAHVMQQAAPHQPSLVTIHVALDPYHERHGLLCDCWWSYGGVRRTGNYRHILNEAGCSFCHPELAGGGS
jgi:hypothetical protein